MVQSHKTYLVGHAASIGFNGPCHPKSPSSLTLKPRANDKSQIEKGGVHSNPPSERSTENTFTMHLRDLRD
ncbi:hypothetical protein TNCV_639891 [Trichonephila clavipes]|nr:hypothetical protein TNCV_639891 [Trichonephila clavipes]